MEPFRENDFWKHHANVVMAAFLILSLSRTLAFVSDLNSKSSIALQTLILVLVALPAQTGGALLAVRYLGKWLPLRHAALLGCVLAAVPSTAIVMVLIWMFALSSVDTGETRSDLLEWMRIGYPTAICLHASLGTLLWMTLSFPWWRGRLSKNENEAVSPTPLREEQPQASPNLKPIATGQPEFMRRLSPKNSGTLWSISSERHYVSIKTDGGSELLLMRMTDAVDQCRGLDGVRIHRSHWVHRPGVKRLLQDNGKLIVILQDGTRLPVSRSHRSAVLTFDDGEEFTDH